MGWATIVRQGPHRLSDGARRYPRMRAQVNTNPTDGGCEALRKASKLQSEVVVVKKAERTKDKVRSPAAVRRQERAASHQLSNHVTQQPRESFRVRLTLVKGF